MQEQVGHDGNGRHDKPEFDLVHFASMFRLVLGVAAQFKQRTEKQTQCPRIVDPPNLGVDRMSMPKARASGGRLRAKMPKQSLHNLPF